MGFLAVAAILVFMLFMPGKTVLRLSGTSYGDDDEKIFAEYEVKEGAMFSVSFIHSVNQSEVKEVYEVRNHNIYLISCIYSGFGAGVATEVEPGQSLSYTENGEMLISDINMKMEHLSYIVGTVSDHALLINDEEISLRDVCGKSSTVRFEIADKKIF